MKKSGFTLAEILISLGIIGVIAALTLPALNRNTVEAQIGPKLAKAASVFEQANTALLTDEGVDAISDLNLNPNDLNNYNNALLEHMKGATGTIDGVAQNAILTKDGIAYVVLNIAFNGNGSRPPHTVIVSDSGAAAGLLIDINGNARPNRAGEDRFMFSINNDGSLRPKGSRNWNNSNNSAVGGAEHWSNANKCANDRVPSDATYCAGSIFEQNLKVLYQ